MTIAFLCIIALIDAAGFAALVVHDPHQGPWLGMVIAHVALSLGIGWVGQASLPDDADAPRWSTVALFSGLAMFIPALGAVSVLMIVALAHRIGCRKTQGAIGHVETRHERSPHRPSGSAVNPDFHGQVMTASVPIPTRLKTLGKLQALGYRPITTLFHQALQDDIEEIRLVAFGILEKKEHSIQAKINRELDRYRRSDDEQERAAHARVLAASFWELVYEQLVQGDVAVHVLSQARDYAYRVLSVNERDAGMWALLGQIAMQRGEWEEARTALLLAKGYGIAESRVVPYLAELAFIEKDFDGVRSYVMDAPFLENAPLLHSVVTYWSQGSAERSHGHRSLVDHAQGVAR